MTKDNSIFHTFFLKPLTLIDESTIANSIPINFSMSYMKSLLVNLITSFDQGLNLTNIENSLIFILFLRFFILCFRYNLKTSFYITCISIITGYLWYKHLIDLIFLYRNSLFHVPFLEPLQLDSSQLRENYSKKTITTLTNEKLHWYNIGQLLYLSFRKGIVNIDTKTGLQWYIDPLSMIVSNLKNSLKSTVVPIYYNIYNSIIPRLFHLIHTFWNQLSSIIAYGLITRIGKRYCPYLIRWHWTFLLVISILEPFIEYFIFRVEFFEKFILIPQLILSDPKSNVIEVNEAMELLFFYTKTVPELHTSLYQTTLVQIMISNFLISTILFLHIGLILFALFHAIWGQYFYIPFITKNVELHIGLRPKNSIYSGGQTAWQDINKKRENNKIFLLKMWYGWFGHGTNKPSLLGLFFKVIKNFLTNVSLNIQKYFK